MIAVSPENIYNGAFLDELEQSCGLDNFNIYVICKTPLFKFDKSQTRILVGSILLKIITEKGIIGCKYPTKNEFHKKFSYDIKSSNDSILFFQDIQNKDNLTSVKIEEFDSTFDFEIKPEILYIGKSKRMSKRLVLHETYQKILAQKPHNAKLRVYLMGFGTGLGGIYFEKSKFSPQVGNLAFSETGDKYYEENYSILESVLINYFKPAYNTEYVNSDLRNTVRIKKLINNGIKQIYFSNIKDPRLPQVWSSNQVLNEDSFCYCTKLNTYKKGINL